MPKTGLPLTPVAVITGGNRGIGLALAKTFSHAGYAVVTTGRDRKLLEAAARQFRVAKAEVVSFQCNVRDRDSVKQLFAQISRRYSRIHVLVNNAGMAHALAPVEKLSVETWEEVIETNLTGTFLVTRAALPFMHAGSTIVNNLSIAAIQPFAGMAAYNASKFGAMGFTQALREDLRQRGIRVLALLPGATDTDIWNQFWPAAPREKMVSPETVAAAVLHAVSAPPEAAIEEIRIGPAVGVL
jgi:NAD(P)-dependent dehydrogenase (short-subunit alcohol dehydrogenase family)